MSRLNPDGGRSMVPLVNRISGIGGLTAVAVGSALAAIVQQAVIGGPPDDDVPAQAERAATRPGGPVRTGRSTHRLSPLERDVRAGVLAQRAAIARRTYGGVAVLPPPVVLVDRIDRGRAWAFGTAAIPPPQGVMALPDSSLFVAHRTGSRWQVGVTGDPRFPRLLKATPPTVVPKPERPALARFAAGLTAAKKADGAAGNAGRAGTDTGLTLPWTTGQSWTLDLVDGDRSELRFSGGDGRVLAPGPGRLYRLCSSAPGRGMLLLIHDDGLASEYLQVQGVAGMPDGTSIPQGTELGLVSDDQPCGTLSSPATPASGTSTSGTSTTGTPAPGTSTGGTSGAARQLRFALVSASGILPLDGARIGGWTLRITPGKVFAERAGLEVTAGNPLLNFGTAAAPPSPSPSPTARAGGKTPATAPTKSAKR